MIELKPPLHWAGGKRHLVPRLRELYQPYRSHTLVEPFVGGMSIALGLLPESAILCDINPYLINFYGCLQLGLTIDFPMYYDKDLYYQYRNKLNDKTTRLWSMEKAGLFYYLNRTGFNGLCRFNSKGEFNVPIGTPKKLEYKTDFSEYKNPMKLWNIGCEDIFDNPNYIFCPDLFIYLDPPYDDGFTSYSGNSFGWEEQQKLAGIANQATSPIVVSNKATDRILDLYRSYSFNIELISAPRRISSSGDRTPVMEMLAWKNM